jgi:hypothetical protein
VIYVPDYLIIDDKNISCNGQRSTKRFFSNNSIGGCALSGKKIIKTTTHHYFWPKETLNCLKKQKIINNDFKKDMRLVTFKLCITCHNHEVGFHTFFFKNRCDENLFCIKNCNYERVCCYFPLKLFASKMKKKPDLYMVFKNKELKKIYLQQTEIHLFDWGALDQASQIRSLIEKYT